MSNYQYTKNEEEFIRQNAWRKDEEAVRIFNNQFRKKSIRPLSLYSYRKKRAALGIKKGHGRGISKSCH